MNFSRCFFFLVCSLFLFQSCFFVRSIVFLRPGHKDFKKFPNRELTADKETFIWQTNFDFYDFEQFQVEMKDSFKMDFSNFLEQSKTNAFLVVKNGQIIFEEYFNNYNKNRRHSSFSVSKAMLASLLGIALEENLINSYTDPIVKYIPELIENDERFKNITIQHLFEMTSGIKVRKRDASLFGDLARTYYGNNWTRFMGTIEIESPAGEVFEYKQTDAQLLTVILGRVSGKTISAFFEERIWSKIGTTQSALWSYYKRDGIQRGYCCFNALVRDYAKFGQLYLNNGKWDGEQLIPKDWIDFTTHRDSLIESEYPFSFYRHWFPSRGGEKYDYTAQGFNGQMIYINPTKNLLILRFGMRKWDEVNWEELFRDIAEQL